MQSNDKAQWFGYSIFAGSLALLLGVFYLAQVRLAPIEVGVRNLAAASTPAPDFTAFDQVENKKQAFFEFFIPIVEAENRKLEYQREMLLEIYSEYHQNSSLSSSSKLRLQRLQEKFDLEDEDLDTSELLDRLLIRVDELPLSMVLAQAAIESAWGTSRFALVGNNYFGQWCFRKGCGVVPKHRSQGSIHEVAKFRSARASVSSYLRNINTHDAYRQLRQKRANMREKGQPLSSLVLIKELSRYSERGQEYINELRQIISSNQLTSLDAASDSA